MTIKNLRKNILAEIRIRFVGNVYFVHYPFRPHRLLSSMWYFPMIFQSFLKISSKFGECVQIQTFT